MRSKLQQPEPPSPLPTTAAAAASAKKGANVYCKFIIGYVSARALLFKEANAKQKKRIRSARGEELIEMDFYIGLCERCDSMQHFLYHFQLRSPEEEEEEIAAKNLSHRKVNWFSFYFVLCYSLKRNEK